jgi:hypothetical protein
MKWLIDDALLNASRGHYFRVLAKSPAGVVNTKVRPAFSVDSIYMGATIMWQGNDIVCDSSYVMDWGNVALPPVKNVALSYADHFYGVYLWSPSAGTFDVDTITFLGTDSFMIAESFGYGYVAQNDYMEINSITDMHTIYSATNGRYALIQATTKPLMVFPGMDQQLRIVIDNSSTNLVTDTISVRLYYRPRRLSI